MLPHPLRQPHEVAELAGELRSAGRFMLDLEFMSEGRYVPELALVQVGWAEVGTPASKVRVAAIDPVAVDPRPVLELIADPDVETVLHAARGDLALLGDRYQLRAHNLIDTQIAAAFLGYGDQIGYANLIDRLLGHRIDKASQFTDWLKRPLSDDQLRYALDDVRFLLPAWDRLDEELHRSGRRGWVEEESEAVAQRCARRIPPEEIYRKVKGWNKLRGPATHRLVALAAWRERLALEVNKPPSWILQDRPLLELARKPPSSHRSLAHARGIKENLVRRHGDEVLKLLSGDGQAPLAESPKPTPLDDAGETWVPLMAGLVKARCQSARIASRFVASRDDLDDLARWWQETGNRLAATPEIDPNHLPPLPILNGWRRELAGQILLDWLAGRRAIVADSDGPAGIRLVEID